MKGSYKFLNIKENKKMISYLRYYWKIQNYSITSKQQNINISPIQTLSGKKNAHHIQKITSKV